MTSRHPHQTHAFQQKHSNRSMIFEIVGQSVILARYNLTIYAIEVASAVWAQVHALVAEKLVDVIDCSYKTTAAHCLRAVHMLSPKL